MPQPKSGLRLGLGTVVTSAIFLAAIVTIVVFMSMGHEGEELTEIEEDGKLAKASRRAFEDGGLA
ncbi:hypothetical protein [Rhizobium leguminosarum]